MARRCYLVAALSIFFVWPLAGQDRERSLYWRKLDVQGRLDADGRLHVLERHAMIFTGDWNGGERAFRIDLGQHLDFESLIRTDSLGIVHPLVKGDLSLADHFNWTDSTTLRWRSRLPSDPPYDGTELNYDLSYTLSNILVPRKTDYLLDHNFAFPDRPGIIERFTLNLQLDPAWRPESQVHQSVEAGPLKPGESYIVTIPLSYSASVHPAGVIFGAGFRVRALIAGALSACSILLWMLFYRREKSLGRFAPLLPSSAIDDIWLKKNVLSVLPEVIGAAWHDDIGAPEVSAVLARLVFEKKIRSEVKRTRSGIFKKEVLHLQLLVNREEITGYERDLIDSLFFSGDSTDSDRIRRHYKNRGFNPSARIRGPLSKAAHALASRRGKAPKPSWKVSLMLSLAAITLIALAGVIRTEEFVVAAVAIGIGILLYVLAISQAIFWQKRVLDLRLHSLRFLLPVIVLVSSTAAFMLAGGFRPSAWLLAGFALLCLAAVSSVLNAAKSRSESEKIGLQIKLAAAREYFREQLKSPRPNLRDAWYPYLIAFGLGTQVDRWFKAFGGSKGSGHSDIMDSSSSEVATSTGWTGGGGSFGGAGASGSWAVAAGALASGVSAPGSG
ncbi:MAG TPA: hypothetical protein VE398_21365, partial [Acidobacteriota bacterium]|nr:hypothetical protein [Acidobacteriota bacterium]